MGVAIDGRGQHDDHTERALRIRTRTNRRMRIGESVEERGGECSSSSTSKTRAKRNTKNSRKGGSGRRCPSLAALAILASLSGAQVGEAFPIRDTRGGDDDNKRQHPYHHLNDGEGSSSSSSSSQRYVDEEDGIDIEVENEEDLEESFVGGLGCAGSKGPTHGVGVAEFLCPALASSSSPPPSSPRLSTTSSPSYEAKTFSTYTLSTNSAKESERKESNAKESRLRFFSSIPSPTATRHSQDDSAYFAFSSSPSSTTHTYSYTSSASSSQQHHADADTNTSSLPTHPDFSSPSFPDDFPFRAQNSLTLTARQPSITSPPQQRRRRQRTYGRRDIISAEEGDLDDDSDDADGNNNVYGPDIPDRYELGDDGRWHKVTYWTACSKCQVRFVSFCLYLSLFSWGLVFLWVVMRLLLVVLRMDTLRDKGFFSSHFLSTSLRFVILTYVWIRRASPMMTRPYRPPRPRRHRQQAGRPPPRTTYPSQTQVMQPTAWTSPLPLVHLSPPLQRSV